MKQLLTLLVALAFASPAFTTAYAAEKKPVPKKVEKVVKKHKKAEPTGKVADDKPTKPAKIVNVPYN